jgi:DNA polymerase-1
VRAALSDNAQELASFKEIARLRTVELQRPEDSETNLESGAAAARRYGMNRLAERLEKAHSVSDL